MGPQNCWMPRSYFSQLGHFLVDIWQADVLIHIIDIDLLQVFGRALQNLSTGLVTRLISAFIQSLLPGQTLAHLISQSSKSDLAQVTGLLGKESDLINNRVRSSSMHSLFCMHSLTLTGWEHTFGLTLSASPSASKGPTCEKLQAALKACLVSSEMMACEYQKSTAPSLSILGSVQAFPAYSSDEMSFSLLWLRRTAGL